MIRDVTSSILNKAQNELLSTAIDQLTNHVMITDKSGIIEYVNPAFEAATGYLVKDVIGRSINFLNSEKKEGVFYKKMWHTINSGKIFKSIVKNKTKDNNLLVEELSITPILDAKNEIRNFVAVYNDITEEEIRKEELRIAQEKNELIKIASVLKGQDNERKRLSKELHDGMGQLLSALKIQMEIYIKMHQTKTNKLLELNELLQLIESAGFEAKRISYGLLPSVLEDFGLKAGLKKIVKSSSINTVIKLSFESNLNINDRFGDTTEMNLYRITQECINNALKHSQAKNINIYLMLDRAKNELVLGINDNGIGFNHKIVRSNRSSGNGLINIEERCKIIKATFELNSTIGKGCEYIITVNL